MNQPRLTDNNLGYTRIPEVHPNIGVSFRLPLGSYTGIHNPLLQTTPIPGCAPFPKSVDMVYLTCYIPAATLPWIQAACYPFISSDPSSLRKRDGELGC